MLVELNVVEQGYRVVFEVLEDGLPVIEPPTIRPRYRTVIHRATARESDVPGPTALRGLPPIARVNNVPGNYI